MKKFSIIAGIGNLAIGVAMVLFDFQFMSRYEIEFNDVEFVQQGKVFEWTTGERQTYTIFPMWFYGVVFILIAATFFSIYFRKRSGHQALKSNANWLFKAVRCQSTAFFQRIPPAPFAPRALPRRPV